MIRINKTTRQFILLCIAITYLLTGNMLAIFSTGFPFRDYLRCLLAIWGIAVIIETIDFRKITVKNITFPLLFLGILIIPTTAWFYCVNVSFRWMLLQIGDALTWIGVFVIAYRIGLQDPQMIKKAAPFLACSIALYAALFTQVKIFSAGQGIPLISTAYYTLFFLPFALASKQKTIKWGGIFLVLYTILLSMKRTGFIAFIAGIVVFIIAQYKATPKKSLRRVFALLSGVIMILVIYFFIAQNTQGSYSVLDRLAATGDADSEGRTDVWKITLDMIRHSDSIQWLFGHGFDTVLENSPLKLSAHNDFLEVIYDYGLCGLALYLAFYKRLWSGFVKLYRKKSDLAAPMCMTFAVVIVVSLFSHLIIFPTYFLGFCLFWGLAMGSIDAKESNSLRY